jgi:hypothetical protein
VADQRLRHYGWAAITLLFAAGSFYVLQLEPAEPSRPAPVEHRRTPPAGPVPAAGSPMVEPVREQVSLPAPPRTEEPKPPDLPIDPRERLKALEPLRQEVFAGLADLAGRVEGCGLRDASLSLALETLDGRIRVLEVRVLPVGAGTGGTSDAEPVARDDHAARCVRGALERTTFTAPSAKPGRKWGMAWAPGMAP